MSITTGPFTVTGGATTNLTPPPRAIVAAVVLQNVSALNLLVNQGNSGPTWLAQFQANVFLCDATNANVQLTAPAQSSLLTGQVLATWYDPGELAGGAITGTYPMTLFGSAISAAITGAISSNVDLLGQVPTFTLAAAYGIVGTFTAKSNYPTIEVEVLPLTVFGKMPVAIIVGNLTKGTGTIPQTIALEQLDAINGRLFFPVACSAGDQILISAGQPAGVAGGAGKVGITAWGLGTFQQPSPLRPDGRLYPVGMFQLYGTGGPTAIPAPTGLARILLKGATLSVTTTGPAGGFDALTAVLNGAANGVVTVADLGGATATHDWESGLLCDAATAVTIGVTAGSAPLWDVSYDLVA